MSHAPDPFIDTAKCCALRLAALPDVMSCLKVDARVSVLPCDRGPAPSVGAPVLLSVLFRWFLQQNRLLEPRRSGVSLFGDQQSAGCPRLTFSLNPARFWPDCVAANRRATSNLILNVVKIKS